MFAHSRVQPRACSGLCLAPSVTMNPASFVSILAHKRKLRWVIRAGDFGVRAGADLKAARLAPRRLKCNRRAVGATG